MSQRPLVTAAMPVYNGASFIRESLDSILSQDYQPLEVLVVDDASTDQTPQILASYGDRLRVVRHETNRGLGAARNSLVEHARGEFVAFLDADDLWLDGKISAQVEAMLAAPEAGLCHTAFEEFGAEPNRGIVRADADFPLWGECFERLFESGGININTSMVRRSCFPAHGFYHDLHGVEDYAMWLDISLHNPVTYCRDLLCRYRRHDSQMTSDRASSRIFWFPARYRVLERATDRLSSQQHDQLYRYAIEQLEMDSYQRYWRGDYKRAQTGFAWLGEHGRRVPLKHRLKARALAWRKSA